MRKSRRYLAAGALSAALVSLVAYASQSSLQPAPSVAKAATVVSAAAPSNTPSSVWAPPPRDTIPLPTDPPPAPPTHEDVGDAESFGRPLRWLGVAQTDIVLSQDCSLPEFEGRNCAQTLPAPAQTTFSFQDTATISLPGNAAHSLLCHWFSPMLMLGYENPSAQPVTARLRYSPRLRIQSEVLLDPALVDPTRGQPFGGSLLTPISSHEQMATTLLANEQRFETLRDSNTCIAGFLTRRQLVETYGLTEAQARRVFQKPITISMEIDGAASYLPEASLVFGLRIVGD